MNINTEKPREIGELIMAIEDLKQSEVKILVDTRIREFKEIGEGPSSGIFKELCFCILTANFSAERSIKIQREIGNWFLTLSESLLAEKLRELGHRYPEARARYIMGARRYKDSLKDIINSFPTQNSLREWLVRNVKGIGYKEASHFLRNIGYSNYAILDFHIIDLLARYNLIKRPKTLTRRRYLEIEGLLWGIARETGLSLGELDLFMWYMETGKVLK